MAQTPSIKFHYLKSPFFRTVHVDGMIGGLTPQGFLHVAVYNERPALPQISVHEVMSDGTLSAGEQEGKDGIVREMDCDLVMTRGVATALRDWLNVQIDGMDT